MKYTKYLSTLVGSQGVPNMEVEHFKTIMNVVHLEGKLEVLSALKKGLQGTHEAYKYDLKIAGIQNKLNEITGEQEPKAFFNTLLSGMEF
jgi:hypothetical protein